VGSGRATDAQSLQIQADTFDNGPHSLQPVPHSLAIGITEARQTLLTVCHGFNGFTDRAECVGTLLEGTMHLCIGKESERRIEIGLDEVVLYKDSTV
jgi:hypothetical protein